LIKATNLSFKLETKSNALEGKKLHLNQVELL